MGLKLIHSVPKKEGEFTCNIVKTDWGFCAYISIDKAITRFFPPRPMRQALIDILKSELPHLPPVSTESCHETLDAAIKGYFAGIPVTFDCRVDISWASRFGQKVLRQCCRIKPGQTLTYSQLAKQAGNPNAPRDVGRILAKNPTPILIPCHRVIKADGSPGGYSGFGGTAMKNKLIALEKHLIDII